MPVISSFFGIEISIFKNDHNPPHIHVAFQNKEALVLISDGTLIKGDSIPHTQIKKLKKWLNLHRTELYEMWEKGVFIKLEPLK